MINDDKGKHSYYHSHLMLLDYLLSEGVEITWREHHGKRGFCWLLPCGSMAGMSDTLVDIPNLVVEFLLSGE